MYEHRMIPQNLEMHEPVRFGQQYTYHSTHSMKQMLSPRYFLSEHRRLKRGDSIKLIRVRHEGRENAMEEYAEVMVLDPTKEGVYLLVLNGPINLPEALASQEAGNRPAPEPMGEVYSDGTWEAIDKGPVHKFWLVDGKGNVLLKGVPKEEAKAYARGDLPLPLAEEVA